MDEKIFKELSDMLGNSQSNNFTYSNNVNYSNNKNSDKNDFDWTNFDFSTLSKFKTIFDKINSKSNNDRTNLLLSLKPYLKPSRREKLGQYINLAKMFELFNYIGGENIK